MLGATASQCMKEEQEKGGEYIRGYFTGPEVNECVVRIMMETTNKGSLQQVLTPALLTRHCGPGSLK